MNSFKPFRPKADPSQPQPNNIGLIRPSADFGGQIVQAVQFVQKAKLRFRLFWRSLFA